MRARAALSDTQPAVIHPAGMGTEEPLAAGADAVELVLELVALAECADVVATADDDGDEDGAMRTTEEAALAVLDALAVVECTDADEDDTTPGLAVLKSVSLAGPPQISFAVHVVSRSAAQPTRTLTVARTVVGAEVPRDGVL